MPNYRKNKNNRNKNKNKNKNTSSSSVKQEIQVVESTTTLTTKTATTTPGVEPNLPADVRNSFNASAKKSVREEKNVVVVVNVDESSTISPLSNEEVDENASNVDIDTFSGSENTSIQKQSNYSSSSKKSTEIEDQQLNRAVFNIGDSTLGDSVIRETFVKEASSGKNSFKTGSANTKDAAVSAAEKSATQSLENTRINESVSETCDLSEQRSKSTESATEVIESNNHFSSKEDYTSEVIVKTGVVKNGFEKSVSHSTPTEKSSKVIVHQISKEEPSIIHEPKSQVIIHHREEQSSSTSTSHRASKNGGVDLSKKTSTKAAESSTTQTLSFSNVRGQPSSQIIYEPRKLIFDKLSSNHGPSRAIIHQISREEGFENVNPDKSKVIVHQISREENQSSSSSNETVITQHTLPQTTDYKLTLHQISPSIDRSRGSQQTSPRSAETSDQSGKVIDHSIFQQSFAENISKRFNIDQQDHFTQNVCKNDDQEDRFTENIPKSTQKTQTSPSEKNKRVILIPILQENSTQTSPLPSVSDNPLHSNLLEIIKDENNGTKSSSKSEISRQTSSSPLSRSPVICFEKLSESFELNKNESEEQSKGIDNPEQSTPASSPSKSSEENSPKIIEHPIFQEVSTQIGRKSPQRPDNLEPLKIPSFPTTRPTKIIVHPIINESSAKPAFPYSEKSLKTIETSSKKMANQILKEVSSELKSSFLSESTKKVVEEISSEPIITSFPVSKKNHASFRPGFFETNIIEKEINPLDSEAKVIVHQISTKSPESKSSSTSNKVEEKVIVHQISQESDTSCLESKTTHDSSNSNSKSFPISVEKETHDAQYTSRPQDSQKRTIDLQSLRDSADFRQSSSTMTSTYGLTETENKKEIIHQILKEGPEASLQKEAIDQSSVPCPSGASFAASNVKEIPPLNSKEILHQIIQEESKGTSDSCESISKSNLKDEKPKVIPHQISKENTSLNQSPSFPFLNEENEAATPQKNSTNLKDVFPLSSKKIRHPEQYNSKSTVLEQKIINFERLREESKLIQSSPTPFTKTIMKENKDDKGSKSIQSNFPASSSTPFPVSVDKQKPSSFTSQTIFKNKCELQSFPISSSFPISVEKEKHATQYTSRPEDSQPKTIDLQSLRDSAELRQSSSTMTSTYGLTEIENKKEIIQHILKEMPPSDLQKQATDQSSPPGLSNVNQIPSSTDLGSKNHVQKTIDHQSHQESSKFLQSSSTSTVCPTEMRKNKDQPKEIIHPILREKSATDLQPKSPDQQIPSTKESNQPPLAPKEIIHQIVKEDSSSNIGQPQTLDHQTSQDESISSSEGSVLTAILNESPRSISPPTSEESKAEKTTKRSFFLAPIQLPKKTQSEEALEVKQDLQMISPEFVKVFNHPVVRQIEKPLGYRVESPQPDKIPMIVKKSKSFDDDEVVIQEMSDTSSAGDTDNPPVISEAESETDTIEAVDDLPDTPTSSSLLSIQTLPIDHESDNLSPKSSQEYKTRRQQNRAALESHFLPQFLAPNFLDSIKEENSDLSDSDRRSSCSDRVDGPMHQGDLEDDVFLDPPKKANAVYPKSNLDFSKKHKHVLNVRPPKTSVIREEAFPPSVVEAKIIDQGSIEESCSSWSTDLTPESEAAEVVYIDSASSSVSDLLELDYSQGQPDDSTDVRIQTPTIDLESVNEMFATCQQIESNDRKIYNAPSERPPPPPPVNDNATTTAAATASIQENNINERNLLPSHNKNDLPDTKKLKLENEKEKCKILDEIISQKIETMSETAGDTHKISDDVSASATSVSGENSIANNLNSCDSAIDQIVTSNTSPSVSATATATPAAAVVVVGSIKNMENIREIVSASSASSKSELKSDKISDHTDHGFSKPNFMIGQPCSDHTLKCETNTSTSSSSSSTSSSTTTNTITTTTTKILTLHDLSQTLENTKHLINPLVSPSSTVLDRQESLDSHGSDHSQSTNQSQCTAINQGSLPHCDWNEFDTTTDTTYVSESNTAAGLASSEASSPLTARGAETSGDETESPPIRKLRSLCTEALASMPYGEEVLQELATVAENIREMPYPLPDLPQIQDIQLSLGSKPEKSSVITLSHVPPRPATQVGQKFKSPPPPPVPAPPSKYESWLGVPSESDPNVLVCLSPSQRNAVKSDTTADSLLDMHKKVLERRGYHEYTTKQVNAINQANTSEATKLSKVDSPPPPPLPPRPLTQLTNPNGNTDINDENDDEEDQNNHRLLAIIRDTHESQQQQHQQKSSMTSTSENISRRTESGIHNTVNTSTTKDGGSSCLEREFANTPCSVNKQSQERKFISENNKSHVGEMHKSESENSSKIGGESVMGVKFPTSEYFDSIFAGQNKRFSNIETGPKSEFCSQILATQPKRYSNIETSSFESKKCVENGKVLYDVCDSKREKISEGDQPDSSSLLVGSALLPELSKTKTNGLEGSFPFVASTNQSATDNNSRPQTGGDSENIMSAFKLNTTQTTAPPAAAATNRVESSPPAPPVPPLPPTLTADTTATSSTISTKSTSTSESHINRTFNAKMSEKTFDDFGQHAKEAAAATTTTTGSNNESSFTAKKPSDAFQHEKLFKEFDELSNLLKDELESGKRRPPATLNGNDIPSSVIDYNRVARESKIQNSHVSSTTSTETNRREQMKKLADEIDRTSKHKLQQRREMRIPIIIEKSAETGPKSAPVLSQEPRSYDIPVRVEGGHNTRPNLQHQRSYEIPIRVEQPSNSGRQRTYSEHQPQPRTHEIPIHVEKPQPDRFRRAESMFNISDSNRHHLHHDDWMKYVGDLGSSENICKPFQREVEICYLGRRPNIRAPRMSASTSDLSSIHTYDTHGAYDVRRTAQTPRPQQPPRRAYLSTQSLIDTTPITPCVSARRSPAPERRSSLPREIHDKQLQYITSKEQQLKYEFERLENERRHLIDEMNRVQMNQRISREAYRQRQLPPLTEDESFRQQMAEEWLHKVAEREERRLAKIIKISKINQEAGVPVAPPRRHSAADDIGDEFLRRVKERRSKLCMPSDSDWESGAESHPLPRTGDGSRSENEEPPVTVFEGQSTANIKQLPKHLREFAKLTSQMKEEHREQMTENTSTSASKMTSSKTTVKMTGNNHSSTQESQSMQKDAAHVRDLEQQLLSPHNGKRPKLVTILRHKKPAENSGSGGVNNCQQSGSSTAVNSAIKRRKQTRFLLTPNRRSWSESDLLREIDKELVLAKGFLYANESIEMFAPKFKATAPPGSGVWTPKNQTPTSSRTNLNEFQPNQNHNNNNNSSSSTNSSPVKDRRSENRSSSASACGRNQKGIPTPPPPPLWTPQPERKQFRPVHFESPTLQRKYVQQQSSSSEVPSPPWSYTNSQPFPGYQSQSCTNLSQKDTAITWPPRHQASSQVDHQAKRAIVNEVEGDILNDDNDEGFSPTTSIAEKIKSFERSHSNNELHRPLVRLNPHEKPAILKPNEVIFCLKNEYMSEPETEYDKPKKMAQLSRRQYDGIGPTTKHGMPLVLRSEVKEPNQHEWYKRIFQTIHKQKNPDDYVTIRYKCPRGRYPYKANGYMSEPEPNYDSDYSTVKYRTLERRRLQSTGGTESRTSAAPTGNEIQDETFYGTMPNPVKSGQGSYKVQPGRIENYITGHSSVSEKEKKEWWDEVMDIFNGQLDQQKLSPHYTEGNLSRALLKEQGYTSDSNLVFRKKDVPILQSPLSPVEQKQVYKSVQAGGQPPLLGFRKPAPEKPKETEFEYLPITPTLTKIRVHSKELVMSKNHRTSAERGEFISNNNCYPISNIARPMCDVFAPFPKNVPSFIPLHQAPMPPNRKSSRIRTNSMALKISSSQVRRPTSANSSRHEACFQTKDAIISPTPPKPTKYGTITLRKTVRRTEPLMRSKSAGAVVSILTTAAGKEEKLRDGRVSRKQQSVRLSSSSPVRSASRLSTFRATSRSPVAFGRSVSKERSFAEEKKRIEESLPSVRTDFTASTNILRDPRLKSPDQVKRAVRSYAFPIERSKSAPRVLPPIKPAMSSYISTYVVRGIPSPQRKDAPKRGQSSTSTRILMKSPAVIRSKSQSGSKLLDKISSKPLAKTSSTLSLARTSSTFSVDSVAPKVKPVQKKPLTICKSTSKIDTEKPKRKPITICSSKSDSNVLKKIKESPDIKKKIIKAIPMQQKIVRTNQFFQNLFMRDHSPQRDEPVRQASVHEKTRYWNTMSIPPQRAICDSRAIAYRSLSPPVRPHLVEEYESVAHFHSEDEESEFGDRSGRTEDLVWQYEQRSRSEPRPVKPLKSICDIARPASPAAAQTSIREFSPTREIRVPQTREMRSPSRRRIQNFRDSQRSETGKVIRASSLSSADDRSKKSLYNCDEFSHSANSLDYIERHSPSCRFSNSDRFIDLNRFYSTLERVGQLERATSASSLKPIRKEGEPLDFEEWRKIRCHERAERELSYLVGKLKEDQKQKDFLFRPKDIEDVKWIGNRDLSLKSKEKSVEDLRENFEKKIHQEWLDENKRMELESKKDTYKPYWRGSSVVDLASNMEIKFNSESGSYGVQKTTKSEAPAEKPLCLSKRLISTLSKDQVSKITKQLNEIYNASEPKTKPDVTEEFVITVDKQLPSNALKVRCNSSISKEELIGPVLRRKEASEKSTTPSKKIENLSREFKTELTEADKKRLSQNFSREIQGKARSSSPNIVGRETRGAIAAENAKLTPHEIPPPPPLPINLNEMKKPAPPKPKRKLTEDHQMTQVEKTSEEQLPDSEPTSLEITIIDQQPDETVSKKIQYFEERKFEESPKTIYHAREDSSPDEDEIMRVIEANIKARAQSEKYHHREMSSSVTDLKDLFGEKESSRINFPIPRLPPPPDETIYHETMIDQNQSTSTTLRASRQGSNEELETLFRSRSVSPQSKETSYLHRVNTGEVQKIKDKFESLGRTKKKKHFFALSPLRKVRSDPELSNDGSKDTFKTIVRENELGDVSWIAHKFEVRQSSGRGRSRVRKPGSPIQRMPIRKEDRLMPHIDVISKTASLKQEMMKSRSPSPARQQTITHHRHPGGIERIRSIFETSPDRTSPVGQPRLGTSSPELRDISPHLTASWIAHKFPKPIDNNIRSPPPPMPPPKPEKLAKSDSLPVKEAKRHERCYRSRSTSPPKSKQKQPVISILKPRFDFFANQKFDPLIHRPKARYVPDSGDDNLKKSFQSGGMKKMTAVKFKDDDDVPPTPPVPPTKGVPLPLDSNGSYILESPNRYFESDVNIHYKTPIRYEYKDPIPEEELAIRQAETMQKLYQEERRRKYLQELQDMNSRRHTDNFTPSQKSPIPLNRYDDFNSDLAPKSPNSSNYPRTVARALYNFQGQTARELTFKKGDVIYIRRQIDKNWFEGEHNAMIGLLPSNYVELLTKDGIRQPPKKPSEGQARAKYNFQAQSGIELSLNKGEHVILTRRVDENWYEGKIANRKGIFPVSYVEVLVDIGADDKAGRLPVTKSIITQSSSSMRPSLDTLRTNINNEFNSLTSNGQPPNGILRETRTLHKTEVLHVDTNTEPVAYRALYKYRPQNTDELELQEGDIVFVLEKCDDGWFVGTSQRSGCFGTFPGNYVERV